MGRVVQSPKIQISIASATSWSSPSPGSSRFPKDSGVEVANWGCCWNWLTSSQMGNQPTELFFLAFQENFCQYLHCLFRARFFIPHFGKVSPAIT